MKHAASRKRANNKTMKLLYTIFFTCAALALLNIVLAVLSVDKQVSVLDGEWAMRPSHLYMLVTCAFLIAMVLLLARLIQKWRRSVGR